MRVVAWRARRRARDAAEALCDAPLVRRIASAARKLYLDRRARVAAGVVGGLAAIAALGLGGTALVEKLFPERPLVTWTMVDVAVPGTLGDAHLLEFSDGRVVLIDTGWGIRALEYLLPILEKKGIHKIYKVIVTNPKESKYGGVAVLLENGFDVTSINFNPPPREACESRPDNGCDYGAISKIVAFWERFTGIWPMATGQVLIESGDVRLRVFATHDALSPPVGPADVADATSLLSLEAGNNRVLFASDLGQTLGGYLAEHRADDLDFNILKAPHYGTWVHPPWMFLRILAPRLELALVPTTEALWQSPRSSMMREALEDVPSYFSQRHGNVEVRLFEDRFEVSTWHHGEDPPNR